MTMLEQVKSDISRWRFEIKQARERARLARMERRAATTGPIGTRDFLRGIHCLEIVNESMRLIRDREAAILAAMETSPGNCPGSCIALQTKPPTGRGRILSRSARLTSAGIRSERLR